MNDIILKQQTPICDIAEIIREDWHHISYGAIPYLDAMDELYHIDDVYGLDNAKYIILHFLSNASHWKGDVARQVKEHLKSLVK